MTRGTPGHGPAEDAGTGRRFCIVASRFNQSITDRLVEGAVETLERHGTRAADVTVHRVPGAFELPLAVRWVLEKGGVDGVIALGCVIRGETPHFEYVSLATTVGLEAVARDYGLPVGFGILTTDDGQQARARAGGAKGNKGEEAALAILEMCELAATIRDSG